MNDFTDPFKELTRLLSRHQYFSIYIAIITTIILVILVAGASE